MATPPPPRPPQPPPPPPPPPPMPMEVLPFDIQRLILERLPCPVDRARMSAVCRAWRHMMREQHGGLELEGLPRDLLTRPLPLPWLLLPPATPFPGAGSRTRAACVLSGGRVHHHVMLPPGLRFFGSHGGAWVLLDNHYYAGSGVHWAVNLRTRAAVSLPGELRRRDCPHVHKMFIHTAALSAPPNSANYFGAAIVASWRDPDPGVVAALVPRRRCVALWRRGSPHMFDYVPAGDGERGMDPVDVIWFFYQDPPCFVFLTGGEHLRLCTPSEDEDLSLVTDWQTLLFRPRASQLLFVRDRYIVESAHHLLMVVRFMPHRDHSTSAFKVFKITERNMDGNDDFPGHPWAWTELNTLAGKMLFVGHGCSKCYSVSDYPGFSEGICFLDDGKFYEEEVIFGANPRPYPCTDNGMWSGGQVQRCFPTVGPSDHCAPIWLFP